MKKLFSLSLMLVLTVALMAQVPMKFQYQSVIRDASGNLVKTSPIGVKASILNESAEGSVVFSEVHAKSTNENGLLSLEIGGGTANEGDFATLDWSKGSYFLKIEVDVKGGSDYTITTTQQLLSVPYALYAGNVANGFSGNYEDLKNKPTDVSTFANDAKYVTEAQLLDKIAKLQEQLDTLSKRVSLITEDDDDDDTIVTPPTKTCGELTVTDVDNNVYHTVLIGTQCWFKENLRTTKYANNTPIEYGNTNKDAAVAYYYYPNNNQANVADYGLLYNWTALMNGAEPSDANPSTVQGVCPTGWHVPSYAEWGELKTFVNTSTYQCNGDNSIAKALASNKGWNNNTTDKCLPGYEQETTNNATGFSAMPAGLYNGNYLQFSQGVHFWTSTIWSITKLPYQFIIYQGINYLNEGGDTAKSDANSVRCVQNK